MTTSVGTHPYSEKNGNSGISLIMGGLFVTFALNLPCVAGTVVLTPAASKAWDDFVAGENGRMEQRLAPGKPFLWLDEDPERLKRAQAGEVVIAPLEHQGMRKVPSGLVHHWIGAIFVPDARIQDVLQVVRDYPRYKELYQPGVTASKAISKSESKDRFSTLMVNRAFLLKSAFETDYESSYVKVDEHRTYSVLRSTRIQEIEDFGAAGQKALPEGSGSGIMWKQFSVTRYEERNGGVFIEVEAMGLTRDIPGSLHWMVDPIVKRLSRSALTITLRQTEKATRSAAEVARNQQHEGGSSIPTRGKVASALR